MTACASERAAEPLITSERGRITEQEDVFGNFYTYVPTTAGENPGILVLIHGTPVKDEAVEWNAEFTIANWADFAERQDFILIAPVFNQEDFSSRLGDQALGGYRGLFGREIGADEWVLRLVNAYQKAYSPSSERFSLYGHSAGGQFVGRFLMTQPERVKGAVITSAATYPQPTADVAWPFGMGALQTDIEWDSGETNHVEIVPNEQSWLQAAKIPLTVIVGLNDIVELPADLIPGQKGSSRLVIAKNWVTDMKSFAELNGVQSSFNIEIIPGQGHTMSGLLPFSQAALGQINSDSR